MKKLLITILLLGCGCALRAQSLDFSELTNFTQLTRDQVHNYLRSGRVFKLQYEQQENGDTLRHYQAHTADPKRDEFVVIGKTSRSNDGGVLRTVNYYSTSQKDIVTLINQAKQLKLDLIFEGADRVNYIYLFDNPVYRVTFNLALNKNSGSVEVQQKDFSGFY